MGKETLKDYLLTRYVIENPFFITRGDIKHRTSSRTMYIPVSIKIRNLMKLSTYNNKDFRVIIIRKGKVRKQCK